MIHMYTHIQIYVHTCARIEFEQKSLVWVDSATSRKYRLLNYNLSTRHRIPFCELLVHQRGPRGTLNNTGYGLFLVAPKTE